MEVGEGGRAAERARAVEGGGDGDGEGFVLPDVVAAKGGEEGYEVEVEGAEDGEGLRGG